MVLDEENMAVWLWFGAKRGLVSKRTALRQAQSLKGHGYTIGKSIVGRGLDTIHEIDERKIGRDSETDELNNKFMGLLSKPTSDAGGHVVTFGGQGEPLPIEEHFKQPAPIELQVIEPKVPTITDPQPVPAPTTPSPPPITITRPMIEPPAPEPQPIPISQEFKSISYDNVKKETIDFSVNENEYDDDTTIPEPAPVTITSGSMESVQKGCVIMAILSQFKDIWVSRLDDNTISVEYMDGPIAKFHIEEDKVKFHEGAFNDIEAVIKNAIKDAFDALIESTKK